MAVAQIKTVIDGVLMKQPMAVAYHLLTSMHSYLCKDRGA